MKPIRWGIIGLGNIANKFAADLALVNDAILAGVASRNMNKAVAFRHKYNAEKAYGSYKELMHDDSIDIIYVATPHDSHKNITNEAMRNGKHVLCEKPLAVNADQIQQMINVSIENNVFLMEAFWTCFNPSIQKILSHIKYGDIGKVNYINADFSFYRDAPANSRLFNMDMAGGSLLDVGVYPIFLAYSIFGMPEEILATSRFHESGADLQTGIILHYNNGIAMLMSGFRSQSDMVAKIHGEKGTITLDPPWHQAQGYKVIKDGVTKSFPLNTIGKGFTYEIVECINCIAKGKIQSDIWSHSDSINLITITDKIRKEVGLKYPFES